MAINLVAMRNQALTSSIAFTGSGAQAGRAYQLVRPTITISIWRTSRLIPGGFDNPNHLMWWITRSLLFAQSIIAVVVGIAALTKLPNKVLAAIDVGVAMLQKLIPRILAATAIGIAATTKLLFRALDAVVVGIAVIVRLFPRTLTAVNVGVTTLITTLIRSAVRVAGHLLRLGAGYR